MLTDDERQLLINLLTVEIEGSRYPLSPRIVMLKRITAKLRGKEPPADAADAGRQQEEAAKMIRATD